MDYCNAVLAGVTKSTIDKLRCLLNAAARLTSGTWKFDSSRSHLLHSDMHWLDVALQVCYTP